MGIKKASAVRKKPLKILLFGDAGTGKTHFALQSTPGKVLVFDTENGTDLFEGRKGFEFDYWVDDEGFKTASIKELNKAIDYLDSEEGRKQYETFVIDNISDIWDNIQAQRLEYKEMMALKKEKHIEKVNETEIEAFNIKDWADMKKIYKNMMLKLKNLPQNIILIAREKEVSETKPDGSIIKTGEYVFDAEKGTKYAVDFIVRLIYDEKTDKRYAVIVKSRSDVLKKNEVIENPTFAIFEKVVNKMKDGVEADKFSTKSLEENIFEEEEELKDILQEIHELATTLAKVNREAVIEAIKKHHNSANYNSIKDIEVARKVLEELQNINV
ncbi:AAA family ATPase [Paraclostridium dentum]|uniref:AAA family ATPase n=1 Tax=Paraclostridium dentum TaxID=2662455 RepID=UPI003463EB85